MSNTDSSSADTGNRGYVKEQVYVSSGGCSVCDFNEGDVIVGALKVSHVNCECYTEDYGVGSITAIQSIEETIFELQDQIEELKQELADSPSPELKSELEAKIAELEALISAYNGKIININEGN